MSFNEIFDEKEKEKKKVESKYNEMSLKTVL